MKFEEKNARKYKVKKKEELKWGYIYFLMQGDEVVYVGQTRVGISRPLGHNDKDYDSFYMKRCKPNLLDKREREMILKYQPIYNGNYNNDNSTIGRMRLTKELEEIGCPLRSLFIDREIERLGLKEIKFRKNRSLLIADKNKLVAHIKKNYKELSKEQELSLSHSFIENNLSRDISFCLYCVRQMEFDGGRWYGAKSFKDMYYMGKISQELIDKLLLEFNNEEVERVKREGI
jgi:hypothetical protein